MDSEENSYTAINQTYKIWKKNSPFFYDLLHTYELSSPSQTVDWFHPSLPQNDWNLCDLLIGTNTLSQNYCQVISVGLPTDSSLVDYSCYREQRWENGLGTNGFIGTMGQQHLSIKNSMVQSSQVMKARVNRVDKNIIAVRTGGANPEFIIYDLKREEEVQNKCIRLQGHQEEGFGLAWSPHHPNLLLSASYDHKILLYNLDNNVQVPECEWQTHDGVQDVQWSNFNYHIFGSAHQQEKINIWDLRSGEKAVATRKAHSGEVYSIDFNYKTQFLVLSAGEDGDVNLWDTRNLSKKLHSFIGHSDAVNTVSWSPHHQLRFASGSSDRRIIVWDISKLNEGGCQEKGGSEMLFIHGGHRSKVTDLSWSRQHENLIGSCEQSNSLHVWRMSGRITSNL